MNDLSKRLRDEAGARRTDDILGVKNMLLREAADEIERIVRWNQDMVAKAASGGALDGYRELGARAARAEAEVERLRGYITRYLSGDYLRPVGETFRDDGKPSKHDTCAHGLFMWQPCENCIDAYFQSVLDETPEGEW